MGVMPVCSLKYLPKNEALGNCRSSAICCMVISVKRRRFSIAWRVKKQTISLGRLFIVSINSFERYLGVTCSILAYSSTRRMRPSLCSANCIKRSASFLPCRPVSTKALSLFIRCGAHNVGIEHQRTVAHVMAELLVVRIEQCNIGIG